MTRIIGIGASAGGLEAFTQFVSNLPGETGCAYVLVQHLDPTHRSLLSELLGRSASLPVHEIEQDMVVAPDEIYVIPPNSDLAISDGVLKLTLREAKSGPARSIDHFFESLASDQGSNAIAVVLSGAGSDGTKGLRAIKQAGGLTFAQDAASAKYDSMPRSAINTGCVDFVLPPDKIAEEIARSAAKPGRIRRRAAANARTRRSLLPRPQPAEADAGPEDAWPVGPKDPELRKIFLLLRNRTSVDFSLYRINTIRRRLKRRITLHKLKDLAEYHRFLRETPTEVDALYQDLLINVSSFFRNPSVFETLKKRVFPKLVKRIGEGDTLRLWVAGCSTGQEAYTYAIAFTEFCERAELHIPIQIFATDINGAVLDYARAARYTKQQVESLGASRLQRFFTREHDTFRVQKATRDLVIFAQHNLLTDPPFTRVDLISCRNLLIYIESALQQKIIPVFHYALRPGGYLVLGTSESVGSFTGLFAQAEKTQKIYLKKPAVVTRPPVNSLPSAKLRPLPPAPSRSEADLPAADAYREADRLTLARYAPPSVLVNEEGEVLQFRGKVQTYLEIPTGRATLNLHKMARGALALAVHRGLKRARTENRTIREKAVAYDSPRNAVNLEIIPIKSLPSRCFLVIFEKVAPPARAVAAPAADGRSGSTAAVDRKQARKLNELKQEYEETRGHLETLRDQHERTVEELQASNEEVQSSNEELQSLNEELETSNEELESANEELTTLNEELATRNTELRESEQRLREQAQLVELAPLLARSPKDRIIFWNRGAERLYGYTREEALGQTSHLLLAAEYPEPLDKIQAHLLRQGRWEGEVRHRHKDGSYLAINSHWVVNADDQGKLRAILEVSNDITARKKAEASLRQAEELNQRILSSSPDCILVMDPVARLQYLNPTAQRAFEAGELRGAIGSHWTALWSAETRPAADNAYRAALAGETARFQGVMQQQSGTPSWWDVVVQPIFDHEQHPEQLLAVCRDVTFRKQAELATMEDARLANLRADIAVEVARGGELVPILQQLSQVLLDHVDGGNVRIWLLDDSKSLLRLAASAGLYSELNDHHTQLAVGEARIGSIAASNRPHVTHQVSSDPDICDPEWSRQEGITSFAGYPLVFESRVLGVMGVLARQRLNQRLLRELALAADAVALLIQRKRADEERNRLLQQAMDARNEALSASRAKDQFLATLSHELRTPLNPVLLIASDCAEDPDLPSDVRANFETIRNNVVLEAKLIDDLLDLTRIARGKLTLDLKPVDVHAILRDAVQTVSTSVSQNELTFETSLEARACTVVGDPVRLQQVFWNILNNAVKFTPHGGTISVRTSSTSDHRIAIHIADTGMGLRPDDLSRIFEAFAQVERRHGGLGLGLAISRQLLEEHHGTIRAMSDGPGFGSTFEITLPLARVSGPASTEGDRLTLDPSLLRPRRRGNGHDGQPLRVLLVEDHAATRKTLRKLLTTRGFKITAASSMAEARLRSEQGKFNLVISDLGLPDGDGYQFLHEFRRLHPHTPAIALSGYGTEDDHLRSRAAGFTSHLTKPVTMEALDQAIGEVIDLTYAAVDGSTGVDGHG